MRSEGLSTGAHSGTAGPQETVQQLSALLLSGTQGRGRHRCLEQRPHLEPPAIRVLLVETLCVEPLAADLKSLGLREVSPGASSEAHGS